MIVDTPQLRWVIDTHFIVHTFRDCFLESVPVAFYSFLGLNTCSKISNQFSLSVIGLQLPSWYRRYPNPKNIRIASCNYFWYLLSAFNAENGVMLSKTITRTVRYLRALCRTWTKQLSIYRLILRMLERKIIVEYQNIR